MRKRGRRMMAGAAAVLLCACLGGCATEEAPGPGICYRVSGGSGTMYVLGSIHVGNDRMKRFSPAITSAMEAADVFVFECDTQSEEARRTIARLMRGETPLKEQLTAATYDLLYRAAEQQRIPMDSLDALRPWAVASQLSARVAAIQLGVKDASAALALGVEERVHAGVNGRETLWLETPEEQLSILDGFSQPLHDELVKSACQLLLEPKTADLKMWPDWWQSGNTDAFVAAYQKENELTDPALTQEYHDGLVTTRNRRMAERLHTLLTAEEPHCYFVTVGLLHLVLPEDSVLWELEQMGYQVERLEEGRTAT